MAMQVPPKSLGLRHDDKTKIHQLFHRVMLYQNSLSVEHLYNLMYWYQLRVFPKMNR